MSLSLETVRAVARLLHETDLSEIEIDTGSAADSVNSDDENSVDPDHIAPQRVRLQLRRGYSPVVAHAPAATPTRVEERAETVTPPITSSAVGVFYASCEVGAPVKKNQILGRVEALKIPHEVRAQSAGHVVAILVEDGQGVEYGQELIAFESSED